MSVQNQQQQLIMMGQQIIQQNPQAAQQLLQQASQMDPNQIMQAAQQGDKTALQMLAVMMASRASRSAKFGAKLNYIKYLNGKCPDGYEMKMFKKGGALCKKCMKKQDGGEIEEEESPLLAPKKKKSMVEDWRKNRMAKKDACGGKVKKKK